MPLSINEIFESSTHRGCVLKDVESPLASDRGHLKRARCESNANEEWKDFLFETQRWGLRDLFGGNPNNKCPSENNFYTLRLEHREGGAMAKHVGEERIILFRDDRPGAIAKIIFSSSPAPKISKSNAQITTEPHTEAKEDEEVLSRMVQAKIHVLDVKEPYRGYDLGSLLFTEAVASLKHRYMEETENSDNTTCYRASIRCQLDAEEDCRRHNKLVRFYENLGCRVKPRAKIQYINNNDGETYRKVPMQIALKAREVNSRKEQERGPLKGRHKSFIPILIEGQHGNRLHLSICNARVDWVLIDFGNGMVELHTTKGHCARAYPDGEVHMASMTRFEDNLKQSSTTNTWSQFHLMRVANTKVSLTGDCDSLDIKTKEARTADRGLWLLQSSHGTFLSIDESRLHLYCSEKPSFWQADGGRRTLKCTSDTPLRRRHYLRKWQSQTVEYVCNRREKYLCFGLCTMTLHEALEKARFVEAVSFDLSVCDCAPSLRIVCFRTAEWFRRQGHSDWVQLVALVYSLGRVLKIVDHDLRASYDTDHDWAIPSRSWIVGCAPPASVIFSEFCSVNPDQNDTRYNSLQGMYCAFCGLDKVLLTWSSQEYMSELLRYNKVNLPEEAFAMLRLSSLSDWHSKGEYMHLANEDDDDFLPFVADFDETLEQSAVEAMQAPELLEKECKRLWCTHYQSIAEKYGAGGVLNW